MPNQPHEVPESSPNPVTYILAGVGCFVGLLVLAVVAFLVFGVAGGAAMYTTQTRVQENQAGVDREEHMALVRQQLAGMNDALDTGTPTDGASAHPDMVYVPAGYYMKGRWRFDDLAGDSEVEEITRYVTGYWIERLEHHDGEDVPLDLVTWQEASDACRDQGKDLCTEDQWEKACKGPVNLVYPYGDDYDAAACPPTGLDRDSPYPVGGQGCGSGYGVMDLAGGCREWTMAKKGDRKVTKGGGGPGDEEAGTRCAARRTEKPTLALPGLSFRCCVEDG